MGEATELAVKSHFMGKANLALTQPLLRLNITRKATSHALYQRRILKKAT